MSFEEKIRKTIRAVISDMIPMSIQWAKVDSVDESTGSMTAIDLVDGLPFEDVLLSVSGSGLIQVPKVGSKVLIGLIENSDMNALLLMAESIESYLISLENGFKLSLNNDGTMTINGDQYGGLLKVPELVKQLNKNNALLTSILSVINGVPITEAGNGAPSSLQLALKSAIGPKQIGDFSNLENKKIKHGHQ